MTGETGSVSKWPRLEGPLLQPECVADVFRRPGNEFVVRLVLRMVRLMAIGTSRVGVFIVREKDTKLRDKANGLWCRKESFAETRERISRRIHRRPFHVTVVADRRDRSLAGKELLPVAIKARCMFGKLGHIGKCRVAFTNFFPVRRGNFVT